MASSMIHLAITEGMIKQTDFQDLNRLWLGAILPDGAVNGNSHLIQDTFYRKFIYGEHHWDSRNPENVKKLHRDYEITNYHVAQKYHLNPEKLKAIDLTGEPITELADFDVPGLVEEVREQFAPVVETDIFFFTKEMAEELVERSVVFCLDELERLRAGKAGLNSLDWSWKIF